MDKTLYQLIEMRMKLILFSWKETTLHIKELKKLMKQVCKKEIKDLSSEIEFKDDDE